MLRVLVWLISCYNPSYLKQCLELWRCSVSISWVDLLNESAQVNFSYLCHFLLKIKSPYLLRETLEYTQKEAWERMLDYWSGNANTFSLWGHRENKIFWFWKFLHAAFIFLSFVLLLQAFAMELCLPPCSPSPREGFWRLKKVKSESEVMSYSLQPLGL